MRARDISDIPLLALVGAAGLAALASCHGGLGPTPWPAKTGSAPATHAEVRTLNAGYARTRSIVLARVGTSISRTRTIERVRA